MTADRMNPERPNGAVRPSRRSHKASTRRRYGNKDFLP